MKFNIEKFYKASKNSSRYAEWDDELLKMFDSLGHRPTYFDKKHFILFNLKRFVVLKMGFNDDGDIFAEINLYKKPKDANKPVLNEQQIIKMNQLIFQTINTFDNFGYIVNSQSTVKQSD